MERKIAKLSIGKETKEQPSLLSLNDDCLLLILDYLNIIHLLNFRGTCKRIDHLIHLKLLRFRDFDLSDFSWAFRDKQEENAQYIFGNFGAAMTSLIAVGKFRYFMVPHLFDYIEQKCPNLEKLQLRGFTFTKREIHRMTSIVRNLKSLTLRNCQFNENDGMFISLTNNLRDISIYNNREITGLCLLGLSNLHSLCLPKCFTINMELLSLILQKNPTLKKLELFFNYGMDDEITNAIIKNVAGLEEIIINDHSNTRINRLSELANLKRLSVNYATINPFNLKTLASTSTLEKLKIDGTRCGWSTLKNISNMTNLKVLEIKITKNCKMNEQLHYLAKLKCLKKLILRTEEILDHEMLFNVVKACNFLTYVEISLLDFETNLYEKVIYYVEKIWMPKIFRLKVHSNFQIVDLTFPLGPSGNITFHQVSDRT